VKCLQALDELRELQPSVGRARALNDAPELLAAAAVEQICWAGVFCVSLEHPGCGLDQALEQKSVRVLSRDLVPDALPGLVGLPEVALIEEVAPPQVVQVLAPHNA
jgi:hypothetical protein